MPFFFTFLVGEMPGLLQGGVRKNFFHHLGRGYGLDFAALVSSPADRLGSNPGTVYLCAISEYSHNNSQLNVSESCGSTRFNVVKRPLPKEGSNNNILS